MREESRVVYSSGVGRVDYCPRCGNQAALCTCRGSAVRGDGTVRVSRERQGRGGKTVTVIAGLAVAPAQLAELATRLKRLCGSGGAAKDGKIEIQGDHREKILVLLKEIGYRAKAAGG